MSAAVKWTSDGRYFVFQSLHQNISSIWIRPEKSSFFRKVSYEPVQLTTGPLSLVNIQILDLRSNQVSTLPDSDGVYSPRWSPDGRYIAAMPS